MEKFGMMKRILPMLVVLLGGLSAMAQSGKIYGTVVEGVEPTVGATVQLWKDNQPTTQGAITNEKGKFEFSLLQNGSYNVKVVTTERTYVYNVTISNDEYVPVEIQLAVNDEENGPSSSDKGAIIYGNSDRLFTVDPKNEWTFDRGRVEDGATTRNINDFVSTVPGMGQKDQGDPLNFRGGRAETNATYFDNVKLRGTDQMPLGAIEQVSVITGGLPAEYGDVMGAVIVVTTRNPSMSMGHVGRPLTKAEKQVLKQKRKRANGQGQSDMELDMVSL